MWSILSQDFTDFAEAFKTESAAFMDYLEHISSNVVGRGDVYAGDEALGKTVSEMPLSNALLRRFQDEEATYTLPIQPEEKAAFAAWIRGSPLSSANTLRRQQYMAAGGTPTSKLEGNSPAGPPGGLSPLGVTPNRRTVDQSSEPMDETRQRLLDYNETVLRRYVSLVGDAVSLRSSISASPDGRRRQMDPSLSARLGEGEGEAEGGNPAPFSGTGELPRVSCSSSSMTPARGCISADEFFDRYFFRLTQLRVSESQRRGAVSHPNTSAAALPASLSSPPTPSSSPKVNDRSRQSTDDDDFAVVPLFAKRVMTAASGLVMGIDKALNSAVTGEASHCSGAEGDVVDKITEDDANVDPKDLIHYSSTRQQILGLESMVQELQEALRQERRRVAQLTSALEAQGIEVPPVPVTPASSLAAATPAEKVEMTSTAAPMPVYHIDPAQVTPAGTAATASSVDRGESATRLATTASTRHSVSQKGSEATFSMHSASGDMISAATEEDTWACMSANAE